MKIEWVDCRDYGDCKIKEYKTSDILIGEYSYFNIAQIISKITEQFEIEIFLVIVINKNNIIKEIKILDYGNETSVKCDYEKILNVAQNNIDNSFIFAHNHPYPTVSVPPSPVPSNTDIELNKEFFKKCNEDNIKMIDNFIIGDVGFYSFKKDYIFYW